MTRFLREINLGRLAAPIRRHKLTFEKIVKLTDLEWREIGIDRTEVKLMKRQVHRYLMEERQQVLDAESKYFFWVLRMFRGTIHIRINFLQEYNSLNSCTIVFGTTVVF